ncbi:MAG: hypothetical protein IPM24_12915 [Bryobacterales bacterium]|nr:hypothetical protein [Bryobacterales bacterium]
MPAASGLDANNVKSVFTYGDALDRLTEAVVADSSTARRQRILHVYNNTPQNVSVTTYRDQVNYLDGALQTSVHYDGLGRRIKERMREDGATWIETDSSYDGLGRLRMRSNPRRVWEPQKWTQFEYDILGRPVVTTLQDNATEQVGYSQNEVTTTDAAGRQRRAVEDGLGRLTQAVENPGGLFGQPALTTNYTYDAADRLTTVNQGEQQRSYGYDGLGRLTCASNPESRTGAMRVRGRRAGWTAMCTISPGTC